MPRPRIGVGEWGEIGCAEVTAGKWRARTRFRQFDGKLVTVTAWGPTETGAKRKLRKTLSSMVQDRKLTGLSADTPFPTFVEAYLDDLEQRRQVLPQTMDRYRAIANSRIIPGLGAFTLRELNAPRLERFISDLAQTTPAQAQKTRSLLRSIMSSAVRMGLVPHNPVTDTRTVKVTTKEPRALTTSELAQLREAVSAWRRTPDSTGRMPLGPAPSDTLSDIFEVMLGTGARISEVLALTWPNVHLDGEYPTVTITATLAFRKGAGMVYQDHRKGRGRAVEILLPTFAAEVLARRRRTQPPNDLDAVFVTRVGTWLYPNNISARWRAIRGQVGLDWVTSHSLRKTVGTIIEREYGARVASQQLGHSKEAVTLAHYVQYNPQVPDTRSVLDMKLGRPGARTGPASSRHEGDGDART